MDELTMCMAGAVLLLVVVDIGLVIMAAWSIKQILRLHEKFNDMIYAAVKGGPLK